MSLDDDDKWASQIINELFDKGRYFAKESKIRSYSSNNLNVKSNEMNYGTVPAEKHCSINTEAKKDAERNSLDDTNSRHTDVTVKFPFNDVSFVYPMIIYNHLKDFTPLTNIYSKNEQGNGMDSFNSSESKSESYINIQRRNEINEDFGLTYPRKRKKYSKCSVSLMNLYTEFHKGNLSTEGTTRGWNEAAAKIEHKDEGNDLEVYTCVKNIEMETDALKEQLNNRGVDGLSKNLSENPIKAIIDQKSHVKDFILFEQPIKINEIPSRERCDLKNGKVSFGMINEHGCISLESNKNKRKTLDVASNSEFYSDIDGPGLDLSPSSSIKTYENSGSIRNIYIQKILGDNIFFNYSKGQREGSQEDNVALIMERTFKIVIFYRRLCKAMEILFVKPLGIFIAETLDFFMFIFFISICMLFMFYQKIRKTIVPTYLQKAKERQNILQEVKLQNMDILVSKNINGRVDIIGNVLLDTSSDDSLCQKNEHSNDRNEYFKIFPEDMNVILSQNCKTTHDLEKLCLKGKFFLLSLNKRHLVSDTKLKVDATVDIVLNMDEISEYSNLNEISIDKSAIEPSVKENDEMHIFQKEMKQKQSLEMKAEYNCTKDKSFDNKISYISHEEMNFDSNQTEVNDLISKCEAIRRLNSHSLPNLDKFLVSSDLVDISRSTSDICIRSATFQDTKHYDTEAMELWNTFSSNSQLIAKPGFEEMIIDNSKMNEIVEEYRISNYSDENVSKILNSTEVDTMDIRPKFKYGFNYTSPSNIGSPLPPLVLSGANQTSISSASLLDLFDKFHMVQKVNRNSSSMDVNVSSTFAEQRLDSEINSLYAKQPNSQQLSEVIKVGHNVSQPNLSWKTYDELKELEVFKAHSTERDLESHRSHRRRLSTCKEIPHLPSNNSLRVEQTVNKTTEDLDIHEGNVESMNSNIVDGNTFLEGISPQNLYSYSYSGNECDNLTYAKTISRYSRKSIRRRMSLILSNWKKMNVMQCIRPNIKYRKRYKQNLDDVET